MPIAVDHAPRQRRQCVGLLRPTTAGNDACIEFTDKVDTGQGVEKPPELGSVILRKENRRVAHKQFQANVPIRSSIRSKFQWISLSRQRKTMGLHGLANTQLIDEGLYCPNFEVNLYSGPQILDM